MQRPRSRVHLGPWFAPSLARSQARCSTFIIRTNFRSSWADHGRNGGKGGEGKRGGGGGGGAALSTTPLLNHSSELRRSEPRRRRVALATLAPPPPIADEDCTVCWSGRKERPFPCLHSIAPVAEAEARGRRGPIKGRLYRRGVGRGGGHKRSACGAACALRGRGENRVSR